ncbi:hypothetical protein FA15DRAFT_597351 [Coprinopsis marcescibilis]|uniref:Nucleotidyltransferase n=1 Tax=Coprinopsis marcescibilis TaxID=230819 RepID=A0A5C3KN90_COPMA|nr:hypothetical protein FA15DRAFT_597351 [Coprinopsis marcescibilis]
MSQRPLRRSQVLQVARRAIRVLESQGYECCLFGSTACALYGMQNRTPKDVDLIVMNPDQYFGTNTEYLKDILVENDSNFYLVNSRNPSATYRVLWYRLPRQSEQRCKVDILVPGLLSIPHLNQEELGAPEPETDLPVLPLLTLLLLKLRGWTDHREDERYWVQEKVPEDEDDIEEMLDLAMSKYSAYVEDEVGLWSRSFQEESSERISEYIQEWPGTMDSWDALGLRDLRYY